MGMMVDVEEQVARWRDAMARSRAMTASDIAELDDHLHGQMADLRAAGLTADEAFLIAVRRLGAVDRVTAEFAREHGDRMWRQLILAPQTDADGATDRRSVMTMLVCAAVAAVAVQIARLAAGADDPAPWFWLNLSLFVLVPLTGYLAVLHWPRTRDILVAAAIFGAAGLVVNLYPLDPGGATQLIVALHLPVALWFVACAVYIAGPGERRNRWMDAVRFTGECVVYYAMIAFGGGVLTALTTLILTPIIPEQADDVAVWMLTSGAAAAVVVSAWLVETKKGLVENIAPVLAAIFTPLFGIMLLACVVVYVASGFGGDFDRSVIIVYDAVLLVVLALILYGLSERDPSRRSPVMDAVTAAALGAALVLDVLVLAAMLGRIGDLGFTANRIAALGLNILLAVDLAVTAGFWLRRPLAPRIRRVEAWNLAYLPAFGAWAALVTLAMPPIFGFA